MSLTIASGQSWLLIRLVTPANFGSSGGGSTLDRPVAVDGWSGLPFLPFSALRGVLAGRLGEVHSDDQRTKLNRRRTTLFGSPGSGVDGDPSEPGSAGPIVLGDGTLLLFPVPLEGGGAGHVVPFDTITRLAHLSAFDRNAAGEVGSTIAYTRLSGLPTGIATDANPAFLDRIVAPLGALVGTDENLIVAGRTAARILWKTAAEQRTLTALTRRTRRAQNGSLRRVELIPSGSLFIALATNRSASPAHLNSTAIQLGAWESWGCGFVCIEALNAGAGGQASVPASAEQAHVRASQDDLMLRAYDAINNVPDSLRDKVRSLVRTTGSRLRIRGIPPTLAFSLAKARFGADSSSDREAHRWLLRTFFEGDDSHVVAMTKNVIAGSTPAPHLDSLCGWLSKYGELGPIEAPEPEALPS